MDVTPELVVDAIDVVARRLIWNLVASEADSRWDSYPDIGEQDWERIVARACELAEHPASYDSAYDLLARRAQDGTHDHTRH